jgi:REP element-mobilizing transposase RayT
MAQSLARVIVHLVFSTKQRSPVLTDDVRAELHPYLVGVLRNHDCPPIQVGGVEDHVHLLFGLSRTMTIAQVAERVKTSSAKWIKSKWPGDFAWQGGYGAFSVGAREKDGVVAYIRNQEAHHRKVSFQDELRSILDQAGVEFDERYLWD